MKLGHEMKSRNVKKSPVAAVFISLFVMFLVSGLFLMLLAMLLYTIDLEESVIKIAIIVIYVLAGMTGGFLIGKFMRTKQYLWGLAAGTAYFVLLLFASILMKGGLDLDPIRVLATMALCCASGMAGGMIS